MTDHFCGLTCDQTKLTHTVGSSITSSYLIRCHEEVDEVVLEVFEWLFDAVLEELLHLARDDGVLVMHHVGEVDIVVVLGQSSQFVLQREERGQVTS